MSFRCVVECKKAAEAGDHCDEQTMAPLARAQASARMAVNNFLKRY
jgi:hypothetical protein